MSFVIGAVVITFGFVALVLSLVVTHRPGREVATRLLVGASLLAAVALALCMWVAGRDPAPTSDAPIAALFESLSDAMWSSAGAATVFLLTIPAIALAAARRLTHLHPSARAGAWLMAGAVGGTSFSAAMIARERIATLIRGFVALGSHTPGRRPEVFFELAPPMPLLPLAFAWTVGILCACAGALMVARAGAGPSPRLAATSVGASVVLILVALASS